MSSDLFDIRHTDKYLQHTIQKPSCYEGMKKKIVATTPLRVQYLKATMTFHYPATGLRDHIGL